jgi:hypothetical protein
MSLGKRVPWVFLGSRQGFCKIIKNGNPTSQPGTAPPPAAVVLRRYSVHAGHRERQQEREWVRVWERGRDIPPPSWI